MSEGDAGGHGGYYILDDDHTVVRTDLATWAAWFESDPAFAPDRDRDATLAAGAPDTHRRVSVTVFDRGQPDAVEVSTVFLGLDHNWGPVGPPLLFETMVFGSDLDGSQWRYATWDEAVAGHERVVDLVRERLGQVPNAGRGSGRMGG